VFGNRKQEVGWLVLCRPMGNVTSLKDLKVLSSDWLPQNRNAFFNKIARL
jgi:hypothetical protein